MKAAMIKTFLFSFLVLAACATSHKKSLYTIGIDSSWYPLHIAGREANVLGFSNELLQEIAQMRKLEIATIRVNWDTLVEGLQKEKYEGILSSMQPYNFNQTEYDFSQAYLLTGPVLVMPEDSMAHSLDMLDGKEIGIMSDSPDISLLEKHPKILIRSYESLPQMLSDIVSQTIDGAIVDFLNAEAYANDLYQGKIKIATRPLTSEGLRLIALHNKNPELIEEFNEGLKKLKKNGRYNELSKKWSLPPVPI
jgi:polar amino acid transport system substrate-binding protein